jgi:hypothetical protein
MSGPKAFHFELRLERKTLSGRSKKLALIARPGAPAVFSAKAIPSPLPHRAIVSPFHTAE